ncbi:WXG100 family type VII secretion target [Streptomyces mangrovi]|uniref:WXG100 family type VII secretion target n=1 Tax=Streptomyces mangrovi TaxID=1206892 RepID=UPI00399D41BD
MTDQKDGQSGQDRPEEPFVAAQLVMTDLKRNGALVPVDLFGGTAARNSTMGTTDFENKDLEEMFSLVDDADPADIESAADTLWDAGGKIRQVGDDLKKHIDKVDWEGEFGDSFRDWGRKLSRNTLLLADFTEKASTQLKAAGVGLSMVRGGMPERDPAVMAAPRLESIPPEERDESNEKYKLAKKKEDNRQEAINQMNRLASYYKVSHDNMKDLEEPEFGPMPNVGMPPAPREEGRKPVPGGGGVSASPGHGGGGTASGSQATGMGATPSAPSEPGYAEGAPAPHEPVRTDLNTVAPVAPPAPADAGPRTPPAPTGGGPAAPGPALPGPAPAPTHRGGGSLKQVGTSRHPTTQVPGQGPGQPGTGRAGGPPTVPPASNTNPRPVTTGSGPPAGRAPTATTPPMGRGGSGIFGGTPQQGQGTSNGPRLPRGTVVGAEHGMTGRPPGGAAGTGAVGSGAGSGSTGRRPGTTTGGGAVGAPRNTPGQGSAVRPFTPGGSGLARGGTGGTGGSGQSTTGAVPRSGSTSPREENRKDSRRPDYLTEDEETWRTGRNGIAPPVID